MNRQKFDPRDYRKKDATHLLLVQHGFPKGNRIWYEPCIPISTMLGGREKVVVFSIGYKTPRVRYVESWKVSPILKGGK